MKTAFLERHYSTSAAAELIGVTPASLRNMRCANRGPAWVVTKDKTIRYPESSLRQYLGHEEKQRRSSPTDHPEVTCVRNL